MTKTMTCRHGPSVSDECILKILRFSQPRMKSTEADTQGAPRLRLQKMTVW